MSAISRKSRMLVAALAVAGFGLVLAVPDADAQRRGGGGHAAARGGGHAGGARASARTSVNRPAPSRNAQHAGGANVDLSNVNRDHAANVNRDVNRNTSINRDTNINRNVNVDVHGDYHDDHWNDWDDHPFATAAAVTAGVAVTSAVIGSIVYSVPPSCSTVIVNGISYSQCGNTWYQPQYVGSNVQYIVVNPPQ
ncbi:hypothetical protein IP90_01105 [Luteimonas cucumeris]|uniref:PXPV repeat-containing protein n=1 Tax=Luteimonas cucumeris TaxID=985012 RepID=A0A562LBD8_9GAMM|nr:hypothetical protein [Luteimonas cucumeris]TWI04963.1 hypothetical protein IP90_01105 [Luteimonas cucumeris]